MSENNSTPFNEGYNPNSLPEQTPQYPTYSATNTGDAYPSYTAQGGADSPYSNMAYPGAAQAAGDYYGQQAYGTMYGVEPPLDQPWYGIDFVNAIKRFFKKYVVFSGRASRGEYWWSYLGIILMSFAASILAIIPVIGTVLTTLFGFAIIIPSISVSVRRLHDSNLSGWYYLLPFAFSTIAGIVMLASFIPLTMQIIDDADALDHMTDEQALELFMPILGGAGIGLLLGLVGTIILIVLMVRKSDPRGVRFDKNPALGM